ncbi:polyribonucleotide nucleotidyltransferase [Pseudomonas hamedanensis]|uniref:Polyribonucleotide nucleotidyltransferase n=1 Tax=Pseudomonas hamedanensis TaxID=2745504 RepID=A0A9E6NZD2_9PSED|nr:polyribonucleotide nucleotidyltransferase [Pseudomonas hamedanensis]QXI17174.1 polyribonucleotide nucleotidyltransferase [Pseudomonas hamedanensis]
MRLPFRLIGGVLVATLLTQITACGSIFYPDRRGQIDGKIDPAIAALDAVGLLFYIIPGLIAFAVDFATGAIYFEPGHTAQIDPAKLKQAIGADGQVDNHKLQAILESELGRAAVEINRALDDPRLIQHKGSTQQLAMFGLQPAA